MADGVKMDLIQYNIDYIRVIFMQVIHKMTHKRLDDSESVS
jgi:hypothetical protein